MRVITFKPQFAPLVKAGTKRQTIRASAWGIEVGTLLSLRKWTGKPYRSPQELLREEFCTSIEPIRVELAFIVINGGYYHREQMAVADGFENWPQMRDFFQANGGLPFDGFLIKWEVE